MTEASARNRFTSLALDRATERRDDTAWLMRSWPLARLLLVDFEGRAAITGTGLWGVLGREVAAELPAAASFLGLADRQPWFALPAEALDAAGRARVPDWGGLRELAAQAPAFDSGLFAYAKALLLWQTRARFCGACGHPTLLTHAGHAARCGNPACRLEHFPRTDAAVIVLVTDGDRALLGRQAGWPERRWSTLAGFVEPGESLEDAVRREVAEESGVRVGRCCYHSSQPWPFPASLMVGFRAQAQDPRLARGDELEAVDWFAADALLLALAERRMLPPSRISVSYRLIADWLLETLPGARVRSVLADA